VVQEDHIGLLRQQHLRHLSALPLLRILERVGDDTLPFEAVVLNIKVKDCKVRRFTEVFADRTSRSFNGTAYRRCVFFSGS
jgi:hypothetical protein